MAGPPKHMRSERERTDASLAEERDRTDEELAKRRRGVEENADAAVSQARERADQFLARARTTADDKLRRSGASRGEQSIVDEERRREDAAVRGERAATDERLVNERDARRRALTALLALEREQTDHRLLMERDRADEAIGSRDDFLAMVSHDLRNMLGGIALSAAALLKIGRDGELGNAVHRHAERIQAYTARMNRLVGDLLDVVSIEAGRLAVVPLRHDAVELLRETLEVFQPLADAKQISITADVRMGSLLAQYDHERILQVLGNLLGNAIKFTTSGGKIRLFVEPVGHDVRFAVSDTGVGIAPETLSVVFDRFWQVPAEKRSGLGLGLGLYISKCIVEAHGGKIWAESRAGEGSTFYFTLPGAQSA